MALFFDILEKNVTRGTLYLSLPDGSKRQVGQGEPEAHWYIRDQAALQRIARDPEFEMGQTYMDGLWDTGEYELRDLIALLRANFRPPRNLHWYTPLLKLLKQANRIASCYRNISHHYDVKEAVFRHFLDRELFYSCAYFTDESNSIEQAQQDKAAHIARKLLLSPGMQVLDIGCGWGSLALYLAEHHQVKVTGITLSREQLRVAKAEAERRGLRDVNFILADYREHQGKYDRIVSVGMMEHVGAEHFDTYFACIERMLKAEGVALVHTIGNFGIPNETNAWIQKYIFPGGRIPSLSEMSASVEKAGLMTTDVESWRLHYACTLKAWYERFQAKKTEIRDIMGGGEEGERFCRMWAFYLSACEATFRHAELLVYQYQVARQHGSVPMTRDYLYPAQH